MKIENDVLVNRLLQYRCGRIVLRFNRLLYVKERLESFGLRRVNIVTLDHTNGSGIDEPISRTSSSLGGQK